MGQTGSSSVAAAFGASPPTSSSSSSASPPATSSFPATKFLVELATTWTLLRLYGTEHPAFARGAEAAAHAIDRAARVSINPRGFTPSPPDAPPELQILAQRLRAMGLIGLTIEPGLSVEQVHALVLALEEADRNRGSAAGKTENVVEKIAVATGGRIRAVPLRLEGLRLVEGTDAESATDEKAATADADIWREMFAGAFISSGGEGTSDLAASAELARVFQAAVGGIGDSKESKSQWEAMLGVWMKQLASIDPARLRDASGSSNAGNVSRGGGGGGGGGGFGGIGVSGSGGGSGGGAGGNRDAIDAVTTFLGTLSPQMSQQLLKETILGAAVSDQVVMALAERLPPGVVLGALAAVDRSNAAPSTAALALLRKMSANAPASSGASAALLEDATPATRAELAEIASTLERLLRTDREQQFVPEEYLQRRTALSTAPVAPAAGLAVTCPDESITAQHAAGLAFDVLADLEAPVTDLASSLSFVIDRVGGWVRAGQFALARESLTLAGKLVAHADPAVAKPSRALMSASIQSADLLEGASHRSDQAIAAEELAALLRHADAKALATLLATLNVTAAGGAAIMEALRLVLPELGDGSLQELFRAIGSTPPPTLLAVISGLPQEQSLEMVQAILPHASGPVRRAAVHVIFRRDLRWPAPLIDQLLRDDEAEIRRLAVMKLVSDTDLTTAAGIFAAASKAGTYEVDVALGLAELLHRHRHHPEVRRAWRQWRWSRRWWSSLLFINLGKSSTSSRSAAA